MTMSFVDRLKRLLSGQGTPASGGMEGAGHGTDPCHINCAEALEKLYEYLDGELESATEKEVQHHFSVCKKCYPHLRFEERFLHLLHETGEGETAPPRLRDQVLELLAAEAGEGG